MVPAVYYTEVTVYYSRGKMWYEVLPEADVASKLEPYHLKSPDRYFMNLSPTVHSKPGTQLKSGLHVSAFEQRSI